VGPQVAGAVEAEQAEAGADVEPLVRGAMQPVVGQVAPLEDEEQGAVHRLFHPPVEHRNWQAEPLPQQDNAEVQVAEVRPGVDEEEAAADVVGPPQLRQFRTPAT
jgi:hypothetical protein